MRSSVLRRVHDEIEILISFPFSQKYENHGPYNEGFLKPYNVISEKVCCCHKYSCIYS